VPLLFGVTMFVSATLLFLVQPMVGKMILPLLGGTPSVWNTCMVFFQALLLLGYFYAHITSTKLTPKAQVTTHLTLLLVTIAAIGVGFVLENSPIPIIKSLAPQGSELPFFGVIALLAFAIGIPFFTVSTTAPLLQKWFSETGHPSAKDPYFLYAASNIGSLLALLAYPLYVEPGWRLIDQAWIWTGGFVVLAAMIFWCSRHVHTSLPVKKEGEGEKGWGHLNKEAPTFAMRLRWLVLAAVPSSLMLGVTTRVTTDMVSMPLLWVIPLALYLLTFIIVFSKWTPAFVHKGAVLITPVLILLLVYVQGAETVGGVSVHGSPKAIRWFLNSLPFLTVFMITLTCHGELARTRPSPKYLTSFYLTMSLGGMIGGTFNALIAPIAFRFISEYPIALVAACLVMPRLSVVFGEKDEKHHLKLADILIPILFFAAGRFMSSSFDEIYRIVKSLFASLTLNISPYTLTSVIVFGFPALAAYFLIDRPIRFGATVGMLLLGFFMTFIMNDRVDTKKFPSASSIGRFIFNVGEPPSEFRTVHVRSFFGTLKVESDSKRPFMKLIHGTTLHGMQLEFPYAHSLAQGLVSLASDSSWTLLANTAVSEPNWVNPPGRTPLTYYHREGPVGDMFRAFNDRLARDPSYNSDVACIGLGTGTLSSYGKRSQKMTFFEIDQTVRDLVEPPTYFSYIDDAKKQGVQMEFLMGDARLTLEQMDPNRKWGFMLVDAFSSDAIPAHLLTKQALELYFSHLEEKGIVALHISNRYLDLEPVVDTIVQELKLVAKIRRDSVDDDTEYDTGRSSSSWIAVARSADALGTLNQDPRWVSLDRDPKVGLWTDDYTPLRSILKGAWALPE
jgi:hypothetical protein